MDETERTMSYKEIDRGARNAESSKANADNAAGDIELTAEDLEAVAGGADDATLHCTDDLPTLCPCAATLPESTCAI
jgi:hypothetical protein